MDAAKEPAAAAAQQQQQQQQINKTHAHSTSFLANDSYIAGMSSDSELTSRSSHHHRRPYSSQSRVYHAHPAPRPAGSSSQTLASSSHSSARMSPHYAPDSSYLAASHKSMSMGTGHLLSGRHLAHQGSVSYLEQQQLEQQQQPQQRRQLPMRPYKQSMSIDQQSGPPTGRAYRQQYLSHGPEHALSDGGQRHYRLEMELAGLSLYEGRPPVPEGSARRHEQQRQEAYQPQDFYPQADWQQSGSHFKQTMSIDHYPMSGHYPRSSPLGYSSSSPVQPVGFESPVGQLAQQPSAPYQPLSAGELHYPAASHFAASLPHASQPRLLQAAYSAAGEPAPPPSSGRQESSYRALAKGARPLEHQTSSGSGHSDSNKELARPASNNGPAKQALLEQKTGAHFQQQQQASASQHQARQAGAYELGGSHTGLNRHALLRKGYTSSLASGLGGSSSQLDEFAAPGDLSSSSSSQQQQQQQLQHLVGKVASRSAMRAGSPSAHLGPDGLPLQQASGSHQQPPKETGTRSESSTGLPNGARGGAHSVGIGPDGSSGSLTKKSNSATQLSMTGTKKRLGFRKKQVTSFSVHRSEEVAPLEARHLVKQGSSVSEGDSSMSGDSSSRSWSNSNFKQPNSDELASMSFIDGLGKGQMISRQGLASPYLGDIQLSLCDRRGNLEVEVIRARHLQAKTNKILPLTYVKLYLVKNRKCLAKAKTTLSNKRTLDPFFQQLLTFHEDYHGCILQSIVWGNFGKMDKKNFMGIAQISIDDLELADTVISWYKLFLPSSLQTLPSKSLRHTLLSNSTESFTNTNNS